MMKNGRKTAFSKIENHVYVALIFAVFLAASIIIIALVVYPNLLTRNAKEYVANKYGVAQSEITEVEEYKAHIETEFVLLEKFNIWVAPAKWVFNVDGKNFNVEYFQKHYVDDFQLEDLELWCTEYLQDNVDSNISGIELYSDMIFHDNTYELLSKRYKYYSPSAYALPYSDNKLWRLEDTEEFLNYQYDIYKHLGVFYKTDNISEYSTTDINSSYDNLVQNLNHNATISNCTLTPILYSGNLELVRNKDCLYLLYNKNGTAITVDNTDLDDIVYNFAIYRKDLL